MEVHFTPEQETQLSQIASQAGTAPERLVRNVVPRYLDDEARFLAAVEKGIAAAERGEFIEEEEMDARLEAMFNTCCDSVRPPPPPMILRISKTTCNRTIRTSQNPPSGQSTSVSAF